MSHAVAVVKHWLDALAHSDWELVFALYDPEALVMLGPLIKPARFATASEAAATIRTISAYVGLAMQPVDFSWESGEAFDDESGTVVMARLHETISDDHFVAGFRLTPDGLIADMVVDPPSAAAVAREAAADLVQAPVGHGVDVGYLTALHHSYARRRIGLPGELRVLPDIRFTCQGRGDCCALDRWSINLTGMQAQNAQSLAKALGGPAFATVQSAVAESSPSTETDSWDSDISVGQRADGACHQLDDSGRCGMHSRLGWQPMPVCQMYPLQAVRTPEGFDISLVYSCKSVILNQGTLLADQLPALRGRLWSYQNTFYRVAPHVPLITHAAECIPWADYRQMEQALLDLLAQFTEQGPDVLVAGSRIVAEHLAGQRPERVLPPGEIFKIILADENDQVSSEHQKWRQWLGTNLSWFEVESSDNGLQRYLRSVLFRKSGVRAGYGLASSWGYVLLAYRMVMANAAMRAFDGGRHALDDDDLMAAILATEGIMAHRSTAIRRAFSHTGNALEHPETWVTLIRP